MYLLASLLLQLDAEDEAAHLLAADALYRLGRLQEAHQALRLALTRRPQAAPVLARLALLQLRRGCLCDASQVRAPLWVECAGTAWGLGVAPHAPPQAPAGPQPLPCVLPLWVVVGSCWSRRTWWRGNRGTVPQPRPLWQLCLRGQEDPHLSRAGGA